VEWDPSVLVFDPLDHPDWYNTVPRATTDDYELYSHYVDNFLVIPLFDGSVDRHSYYAHRARNVVVPTGIDLVDDDVADSDDPFDRGPWKNGEMAYGPPHTVARYDPVISTRDCAVSTNGSIHLGAPDWMNPMVPEYRHGSKEVSVNVVN
jgi:hypothetical protein